MKIITELKNSTEHFKSRLVYAKGRISNLEDRACETTQRSRKKKKKKETKSEESLQELRYTILKRNFIMEIPGEKKDRGTENMFKATMAENFPNLGKEVIIQTQEAQ